MHIGIDIGTSSVKAVLLDDAERLRAEASAELSVMRPQPGWSEQDPDAWITASEAALSQLAAQHDLSAVRGLGLSGQMHGATCLDSRYKPLRPAILWNDTRAAVEAATLDRDPQFREISGNIVFPGFTAPKLAWLKAQEPQLFAQLNLVLLPKDYVRLWLTGEAISDCSDAAGTAWLDTGKRDWSKALLTATQLTPDQMPKLVEGSAASANIRPAIAARFGLPKTLVVAGGAGDNAASAIGLGVVNEGDAFVSLGTSGVIFAATQSYRPQAQSALHCFCHAIPERWHQMGVMLACTDALNWFASLVNRPVVDLIERLGAVPEQGSDLLFLPYLGGERTPHNDAGLRGGFVGLSHETDLRRATQSILEGLSFALRDNLEVLRSAGTNPGQLLAVGGGAQSDFWLELLASTLGVPIARPQDSALGAALGAARLGRLAASPDADLSDFKPKIERLFEPKPDLQASLEAGYRRFREAYAGFRAL